MKYLPDLLVETISSQKAGLSGTESRKRNNGHAMEKLATLLLAKRPSEQHVNQYREGPPPCPHRKATPRRESPDCTNGKTGRATEQLSSQQKRNFLFHLLLILRGCSVARRGFSIIRSRCSLSCFFLLSPFCSFPLSSVFGGFSVHFPSSCFSRWLPSVLLLDPFRGSRRF